MPSIDEDLDSERRKHPRFHIDLPVKYNSVNHFSPKDGRVTNVSEGGLLVNLPEEIVIGHRLKLTLFLRSHSELNVISPSVQVVWTGIQMKKDLTWNYSTGVRFVEIQPTDKVKFKSFLMNFRKNHRALPKECVNRVGTSGL